MELKDESRTEFLALLRQGNFQRDASWSHPNTRPSASFRACELAGEVGEACNIIKKLERERMGMKGSRATQQELMDELADIVICVDLIAMDYKIDLLQAIREKFNATSNKYGFDQKI
jgi:NTP pyrophosphatase (non-canonical NTP hydrolase)